MREFEFVLHYEPGTDLLMDVFQEHSGLTARTSECTTTTDAMWRIDHLRGPAPAVTAAAEIFTDHDRCNECLDDHACDTYREYHVLDREATSLTVYTYRREIQDCHSVPYIVTDHVGEGRCKLHGGASPRGEDHPGFEHGLFSDYLGEEDRAVINQLEEMDDEDKLDEIINWRLARLRRAVRALNEDEEQSFWAAFAELAGQVGEPDPEQIQELARMLDKGNRAVQMEIDTLRKLIKDRNKIAEGEDVNVGWRELMAGDNS